MSADPVARRAHTVIRSLLDGTPLPAAAPCADLGPWAETVQALLVAWDQEGQAGVQRAFVALARQEPALVCLLYTSFRGAAPACHRRSATWAGRVRRLSGYKDSRQRSAPGPVRPRSARLLRDGRSSTRAG